MEESSCSILGTFVLVRNHLNPLVCLPRRLVLLNNFSRLKVEVDQTILVFFVDEKHRALVVVKKEVLRFQKTSTLVLHRRHVHQVIELLLMFVNLLTILIHLDDWPINHECTVVSVSLDRLLIVAIAKLLRKIFVKP